MGEGQTSDRKSLRRIGPGCFRDVLMRASDFHVYFFYESFRRCLCRAGGYLRLSGLVTYEQFFGPRYQSDQTIQTPRFAVPHSCDRLLGFFCFSSS